MAVQTKLASVGRDSVEWASISKA